jgi:hypothetical protein
MNLQEYLTQTEPQRMPIVYLSENDYEVICETFMNKVILIPELLNHFPGLNNEYYIRTGETVCRVIRNGVLTDKKSCFYIN